MRDILDSLARGETLEGQQAKELLDSFEQGHGRDVAIQLALVYLDQNDIEHAKMVLNDLLEGK